MEHGSPVPLQPNPLRCKRSQPVVTVRKWHYKQELSHYCHSGIEKTGTRTTANSDLVIQNGRFGLIWPERSYVR